MLNDKMIQNQLSKKKQPAIYWEYPVLSGETAQRSCRMIL